MTVRKMTVAEWIKVEDNPIQRDTEHHAAKAKHLLTPLPSHAFVFACELPNGKLIKLDGHTRALLWQRGQVWTSLKAKSGMKAGREMDGVQACLELLIAARAGKKYGGAAQYDICNRILTGVDKWLKDDVLTSIPRPMDTLGYLADAPKPLERLIKKADIEKLAHAH